MTPLISLVTPCRNARHLLQDTLSSIWNQRAVIEKRVRLQHIVVDGASTDGTAEIVKAFPAAQFISEPDRSMYDALAKGLKITDGDIVGYLNAGDVLFPWAFDILVEIFNTPGVEWATGYASLINDSLQVTSTWKPPRYRREFIKNGLYADDSFPQGIQQESTFWSQSLNKTLDWEKLRTLRYAGDFWLWRQFSEQAELHSIMSQLGAFRIHQGQLSEDKTAYLSEVGPMVQQPSWKEKLTAYWLTRCNPAFRGFLWNLILPPSPARIFEFSHIAGKWLPR